MDEACIRLSREISSLEEASSCIVRLKLPQLSGRLHRAVGAVKAGGKDGRRKRRPISLMKTLRGSAKLLHPFPRLCPCTPYKFPRPFSSRRATAAASRASFSRAGTSRVDWRAYKLRLRFSRSFSVLSVLAAYIPCRMNIVAAKGNHPPTETRTGSGTRTRRILPLSPAYRASMPRAW